MTETMHVRPVSPLVGGKERSAKPGNRSGESIAATNALSSSERPVSHEVTEGVNPQSRRVQWYPLCPAGHLPPKGGDRPGAVGDTLP